MSRLKELKITATDTPPHRERIEIDEGRFDVVLDDVVGYRSDGPKKKDLKSLMAIDRLRGNSRPRDLAQANALFVTANAALVRASRQFFSEADHHAPVPHAMHETALTAQLWVRSPHPIPDLPRQLLIADCYAALNPGPELWERWIGHILRLQKHGDVSEEQVQNLVYHQQAKSKLFEVTHGDPDAIGDETVAEVLERFEAELREPVKNEAREADAARKSVEAERDGLHAQVSELRDWRKRTEDAAANKRERRQRLRLIAGYLLIALLVGVFLLASIGLDLVSGKVAWAGSITALVCLSATAWAWGSSRDWKTPVTALLIAGGLTTLFVNLFSVIPDD